MRKLRYVLAGILMLGLAFPVMTLADDDSDSDSDGRRCSNIGTWFGVNSPQDTRLTGVFWTAIGKSENRGTNIVEQLNNPNPSLGGLVPGAVKASSLRGDWYRTGKKTFAYTMMGYGVDVGNNLVGIVRFRGDVTLYYGCQFAYVTAMLDIFGPDTSPFDDDPDFTMPFFSQWGKRAQVVR